MWNRMQEGMLAFMGGTRPAGNSHAPNSEPEAEEPEETPAPKSKSV
jgi:hypothetical protein